MDLGIAGRVAVVGASTRGLGYAAAASLVEAGCGVMICGRDGERVEQAQESLSAKGGEVHGVVADLSTAEGVDALIGSAHDRFGPVDILVNNNGGPRPGGFGDVDDIDWRMAFDLTFMSTVRLYRAVLEEMKARRWGRIINIASLSVLQPIDGLILSNAVRMAVQGLAKSISLEVAPFNVTVNSVCPGFTRSERVEAMIAANVERDGVSHDEAARRLAATTAVGRIGDPKEVGDAVAYLASESAAFVTGSVVPIAGGGVRSSI